MSDEQTRSTAWSVIKAVAALLVAELVVSLALLAQALPAYFSDFWNTEATFQLLEETKPVRYPIRASFETGGLRSIQCEKLTRQNGGTGTPLKCRFVANGLFDAEEYLKSIGIRTGNAYSDVSSWPRWGTQSNALWQIVFAMALSLVWLKWSSISVRDDLATLYSLIRKQPQFLLVPYGASVIAMSMTLVAVPYETQAVTRAGVFGSDLALSAALTAILAAPFLEEVLFRGLIYDLLRKYMPWGVATILGSLSFMAMHSLQLAGGINGIPQSVGVFSAGVGLCWLRRQTSSLSACILAHAIANTIVFATLYRQSLT